MIINEDMIEYCLVKLCRRSKSVVLGLAYSKVETILLLKVETV